MFGIPAFKGFIVSLQHSEDESQDAEIDFK